MPIILLTFLIVLGVATYIFFGEHARFTLRLLQAKKQADRFYASYPGITKNIAYGDLEAEKLDVYQPQGCEQPADGRRANSQDLCPVLIWVHGGAWSSGSKELYSLVAQRLMPLGIVTVIPGYTLYPSATYDLQTREVAQALAWTLENISNHGGDPARVYIGGQSAGAHLSALALLDPQWLTPLNHSALEVSGYYGISGPYDITAQHEYTRTVKKRDTRPLSEFFRGTNNFAYASPTNFAKQDLPPLLLIHGDRDETVPIQMSQEFQNVLRAAGAQCQLLVYKGAGHSALLYDALVQNPARLVQDIVNFVLSGLPTPRENSA